MKYVVVTGAFGGMGKSVCNSLATSGYTVFALDRKIEETNNEKIIPINVDVTNDDSVMHAKKEVAKFTDTVFAVCHFAGIYDLNSFMEMDSSRIEQMFQINVLGANRVNKAFLPLLKKESTILLTTSELAPLDPLPFTGIYAVTKSALDKYAYSLRMELQLLGISVVVLRPGAVETDMISASTQALDKFCENTTLYTCNSKRFKEIVDSVEARKISPEKIANKTVKILNKKRKKFVYSINRNPLLLLLNILPARFQTFIIRKILEN